MSIAHHVQILDYVSYQLKLVRSDTYKFFQNWLIVQITLIKLISIALKNNFFMILMIIYEKNHLSGFNISFKPHIQ